MDAALTLPHAMHASPPLWAEASGRLSMALVGFGRFGRMHALRLRAHPRFRLEWVVETRAEARAEARALGFQAVATVAELPLQLHAATVACSSDTHAEMACALMRRGLHVLVEKPLASSVADAEHLLRVASETGRVLCTGHIERFNPREFEFCAGEGVEFHRQARAHHGGRHAVLDLLVHDLDLIAHWLALPPELELQLEAVRLEAAAVEVRARLDGVPLRLSAGYGAAVSRARVRCGSESRLAARLATLDHATCPSGGEDALSRQYSAFHACLCGKSSAIADGMAGLAATRRALSILEALGA